MFKSVLVVFVAAGAGAAVGEIVAGKLVTVGPLATQSDTVKKSLKIGTQAATIAVFYGVLSSLV